MSDGPRRQSSEERVRAALVRAGHPINVTTFDASTRTSVEAAAAIGCAVSQIAKSLIFRAKSTDRPVLVIACGDMRVKERLIERALGEKIGRADADFVRQTTGFAIGGVSPVGHLSQTVTFVDARLTRHERVWAAAGSPRTVFETSGTWIIKMTGGEIIDLETAADG